MEIAYKNICRLLDLNSREERHIIKCPINCKNVKKCSNKLMIWKSYDIAKCVRVNKEVKLEDVEALVDANWEDEHADTIRDMTNMYRK